MRCVFDTYAHQQDASSFTVGSNAATEVIDNKVASKVYSGKEPLYAHFRVHTTVTSAGAATVQPKLYTDSDSTVNDGTLLIDFGAIAKATLVAGYHKQVPINGLAFLQYHGVDFVVGTADLTAGAFDMWIGPAMQDNDFTS